MKNINNEVKALEVALEVATDIQGKSYAYAVTRIQQALLNQVVPGVFEVRYVDRPHRKQPR